MSEWKEEMLPEWEEEMLRLWDVLGASHEKEVVRLHILLRGGFLQLNRLDLRVIARAVKRLLAGPTVGIDMEAWEPMTKRMAEDQTVAQSHFTEQDQRDLSRLRQLVEQICS